MPRELTARFSQHSRLLDYELLPVHDAQDLSSQEYRAIVAELVGLSDLVASKRGEDWLDQLVLRSGRFRPPEQTNKFRIYRARSDAPRPLDPDLRVQRLLRWDQLTDAQARWFERPSPGS